MRTAGDAAVQHPATPARVTVAVIQAAPCAFDLPATLARVETHLDAAAAAGAKLVVFPEAFLGGYPKGMDFGARVGFRTEAGRRWFQRYVDGAIAVPGPVLDWLGERARRHGIEIVIGAIERAGGTLYCSTLFVSAGGELRGLHRKLLPTGLERLIWGRGDGSTMPVFATPVGRVGAAICWENYMPLYRTHLYDRGVQLYCAPTVDDREVWLATMRHIAVEGRCFVLAACQHARRRDYPDDYESTFGDDPDTLLIGGGSCIVDPYGELLAGPVRAQDSVLTATLDLGQVTRSQLDLDVTGHYARGDIFRLQVDERPQGVQRLRTGDIIGNPDQRAE